MKQVVATLGLGMLFALAALPAVAAEAATKDEAVAMVKKAVAFIKEQGGAKAYPEFTNRAGKFIDRDLYIAVYQLDGKVLAHGGNEKLVGQDSSGAKDADGKLFVKERIDLARNQASFWHEYKFMNPVTKKIEDKLTYCERLDETAVCAGLWICWSGSCF